MSKQARADILVFWLGVIGCILVIGYCMVIKVAAEIDNVRNELEVISELKSQITQLKKDVERIEEREQPQLNEDVEMIEQPEDISRGFERLEPVKMRVTAYDLSYSSCRKYPDHPEYGITASGTRVKEWHTIAAGPELPFGTQVFIPYFEDKPNKGIFVVEDRGSAIKANCLDIYMPNNEDCMNFGVRELDVYILN